jgi:hypothetical protein
MTLEVNRQKNPQEYISKEDMPHELIFVCLFQTTIKHIGHIFKTLCTLQN